jgi:hypothetical protein
MVEGVSSLLDSLFFHSVSYLQPARTVGVYLAGGIAGSLASSVVDPNTNVVGFASTVHQITPGPLRASTLSSEHMLLKLP